MKPTAGRSLPFRRALLPVLCMLLFFAGTVVFTIIYMAKDNNYNNTIYQYFNISKSLHVRLLYLGISKKAALYGMNLSSVGFIASTMVFALLFNGQYRPAKRPVFYLAVLLPLAIEFILYSPDVYRTLYSGKLGFVPEPAAFRGFYAGLHTCTICLNAAYLITALAIIATTDSRRYPVKQLRYIKWLVCGGGVLVCSLYFYLFYNLPASLIWVSRVADQAVYRSLQMGRYSLLLYLSPYLVLLFLILLAVALFRYDRTMREIKNTDSAFFSKIASAEVSSRAFSHYIKNELVAILQEVEYVREGEDIEKHLDVIEQECEAMYARLDDLQQHANRIVLAHALADIRALVQEAAEHTRPRLEEAGIQLVLEDIHPAPLMAFCDANYLREVFVNLLFNAMESMTQWKGEKRVTITVRPTPDGRAALVFRDTGPGFDKAMLEAAFEPFVSTKSTKRNWGIGLSFSKRIISGHNGVIEAANAPEGGAVLSITLPLAAGTRNGR